MRKLLIKVYIAEDDPLYAALQPVHKRAELARRALALMLFGGGQAASTVPEPPSGAGAGRMSGAGSGANGLTKALAGAKAWLEAAE